MLWLINDDPSYVSITERDPEEWLERFVMVLFYVGRTPWTGSEDWLSGNSVCDWEGIECNLQGRMEKLVIRK